MVILYNSHKVYSPNKLTGIIIKLMKLIELDKESLRRPDSFLNRHAKVIVRLEQQYTELRGAQEALMKMKYG